MLHLSDRSAEQGRQILQLRYGGHAFGGEHAAALQLPVLVLLQQHRPNQAGDRGIVGEDADDAGAALYFFIHPLQQVGAPDYFPVLRRVVTEVPDDNYVGGRLRSCHRASSYTRSKM